MLAGCGGSGQPSDPKAGWRAQVKQLRISVTAQTDAVTGRPISVEPLQNYLTRATGVPVRVRQVSDIYTSSIQALASGQVDIALLAGGGYANIKEQVGKLVTPLLSVLGAHGETGYYSSLIVRANSPYHTLADLKGKSLAVVDLNSTSGYLEPMHAMREKGIDPESFFSRIGVAGGHQQAVIAVYNGQYDAAWTLSSEGTPQTGFVISTMSRMEARGMIPHGSIRDIWDVGPVPNSSFVMRTDRPQALQDLVRGALAAVAYDDPDVYASLGSMPGRTYMAGDEAQYASTLAMRKEAIADERARAAGGAAPRGKN